MNPRLNILLSQKTFSPFDPMKPQGTLAELCRELIEHQKTDWPQLADGYAAFRSIQVREVLCRGFNVKVQYNPMRIVSTNANTDRAVIRERKCFLCLNHLPEPQKGILYRGEYLVLCNPAPIFHRHFTVSSVLHIPQDLKSSLDTMLDLSRDVSPDFTIFYNGPACGASAPDHSHFQMSPRLDIPVERDAVDVRRRKMFYYKNHVAGSTLGDYGRVVMIIESTDKQQLIEFMQRLFVKWKLLLGFSEEPMMNVICSFQQELWRLIIFPRRKHRPDVFFKEEKERILISPAAVDIGGLIITPLEKDFLQIDAKLVEEVFAEVSEKQEVVDKILETLL